MKKAFILVALFYSLSAGAQKTDWQQALSTASVEKKYILLSFKGSDWCIPCIRMTKEVFEKETFKNYAQQHLVIVEADFPRSKKHQLPKEKQEENNALAEQYNKKGSFPLTLLVDETGTVIKEWEGQAAETPQQFIEQLQALQHAR